MTIIELNDLDVWLQGTLENRQNFRSALKELGYGDYALNETMQFVSSWTTFNAAGVGLDIVTEMKGLENESFDECFQMANKADIDGELAPFPSH